MPVVHANFPTNLFVPAVTPPNEALVSVPSGLHLQQMVQAVIVEADNDQIILEIGGQRYQAQGKSDLQVGEKITLQVQQLEPQLEFKVFNNSVNNWLSRTFPTLSQPFDWGELVVKLQSLVAEGRLPQSIVTTLRQLDEIFNFSATSAPVREKLMQIVAQLQQFNDPETELLPGSQFSSVAAPPASVQNYQISAQTELLQAITALIKNIQGQLSQLPKREVAPQVEKFIAEIEVKLNSLPPRDDAPQLQGMLQSALKQIRQMPDLSPRLVAEVQRILAEIEAKAPVADAPSGDKVVSSPVEVDAPSRNLSADQRGGELAKVEADVHALLKQISQLQKKGTSVPPDLLGRLEGLKLQLQAVVETQQPPGVELLLDQMTTLIAQRPAIIPGERLGILSQLFGLHLETELLNGKKRDALASLKMCLLELQQDGDDVDESLRRLELFQLCKAKLSADQVQFVPLPLSDLVEGYLLAEREDGDERPAGDESPLKMSLSLRLSALGNIRIDMLYEEQTGLHLRLAGEDKGKMNYLKSCEGELVEALQAVKLQGVSFSSDAGLPARQLQERVLAESFAILDTRI